MEDESAESFLDDCVYMHSGVRYRRNSELAEDELEAPEELDFSE